MQIPAGWRQLRANEIVRKGDLWIDLNSAPEIGLDWFTATDSDPDRSIVGVRVGKYRVPILVIRKVKK